MNLMNAAQEAALASRPCAICGNAESTHEIDTRGRLDNRLFEIRRCCNCGFIFVLNPRTDFDVLYSADYYQGHGADTKLNYVAEVEQPDRSVRLYEWRGILERVRSLKALDEGSRWLDYGCGTGGLVQYLNRQNVPAFGFEQGWCRNFLAARSIPTMDERALESSGATFDVVTLIEVIEHSLDPVDMLRHVRRLLRPDGLLLLTTGNAAPFRGRLNRWRYVTPEVHISYFEPETLRRALHEAGFRSDVVGYGPGWSDILRYKVLMSLRSKWRHRVLEGLVPWNTLGRFLDKRLQLSAQPLGWAEQAIRPASDGSS